MNDADLQAWRQRGDEAEGEDRRLVRVERGGSLSDEELRDILCDYFSVDLWPLSVDDRAQALDALVDGYRGR